jgi:cytochrome c
MIYAGMISGRNTTTDKKYFGLQKLRFKGGTPTFEMLAVRARPSGFEIEFTLPVDTAVAKMAASYTVQSYHMTPAAGYGVGSKQSSTTLTPSQIQISSDGYKVYLTLSGILPSTPTQQRVVYFRLNNYKAAAGDAPWATTSQVSSSAPGQGSCASQTCV